MHIVAILGFPSGKMGASYLFMLIAPLVAMFGCFRIAMRRNVSVRWEWLALCVGLLFWEAGLAMAAWQDLLQQNVYMVTAVDGFIYFLFGVPLLLAICASPDDRRLPAIVTIDGILAAAIGVLAYREIFSYLPGLGLPVAALSPTSIALIYDVENGLLAALASMRMLGAETDEEQSYFRTLSRFLWAYLAASCFYNHVAIGWELNTGNVLDALVDVPFLMLAVITLNTSEHSQRWSRVAKRSTRRLIQAGISFSLPLLLLGLGIRALSHSTAIAVVSIVGSFVGYGLRNALSHAQLLQSEDALFESQKVLEKATLIDPLTGVGNRRAFDRMLEREWHRADRAQEALGLLFIDIDHFKRVNDTYGHQRGDETLAAVARALEEALPRATDFVARYGGEEFACILPATDGRGAIAVAERLRAAVESLRIVHARSDHGFLTVSLGATACRGLARSGLPTLLNRADKALYEAKRKGRNRVEFVPTEARLVALRAS
jgi:diguanylate cyclase (GGDEF)-like protein